ncbi:hypothetical protein LQR31_17530 [Chromobacterium vaccinii]|uniref:hypothetical protein n=1 Tax=Chromobacterium vaccinii TaxID=1108595 RepID=UPI001E3D5635|nr:hypothetical protein [Chromobacterium vaccinii]MCD4486276.1 hypothetical protein [Chromobacterium vaccinii]
MRVWRRVLLLIVLQLSLFGMAAAHAPLTGMASPEACSAMSASRDCAGVAAKPSAKHAAVNGAAACGSNACAQACLPLFIKASLPGVAVLACCGVRIAAQPVLFSGPVLPPPLRPPEFARI